MGLIDPQRGLLADSLAVELGEGDPLWADPARRSKVDRAQRRRRITLG